MEYRQRNKGQRWYLAVAAIALLGIGFFAAIMWMNVRYPMLKEPAYQQFATSYNKIEQRYLYGADTEKLLQAATVGMVASLEDPYSGYMIGEEGEAFTQGFEGEFYGIGAEIRQEDKAYIINSVIKESPAEKGGVLPEDKIIKVDGIATSEKTMQQLLSLVRGEKDTSLVLELERSGEKDLVRIELMRDMIPVHTVVYKGLNEGIAYIGISRFAEKTDKEFAKIVSELPEETKGIVLDLRSNSGGLLGQTVEIANMIVPKDKLIAQIVYKNEHARQIYKSNQTKTFPYPIVVLVNEYSASASEVLAAALRESAGAPVVGKTTFGKGVVQSVQQFPDSSVLRLTEAEWHTPEDKSIHKQGVVPDYEVELEEQQEKPVEGGEQVITDTQLLKAMEVLQQQKD